MPAVVQELQVSSIAGTFRLSAHILPFSHFDLPSIRLTAFCRGRPKTVECLLDFGSGDSLAALTRDYGLHFTIVERYQDIRALM